MVEDCHESVGWLLVQDALVGRLDSPYNLPKDRPGQVVRVLPYHGWIEEYSGVLLVFSSSCLLSCGSSFPTFPLAKENPIVRPEFE